MKKSYRIKKIVSGGQTGVDRAALDAAIAAGIPCGGWCPKGRLAELGATIPNHYPLKESTTADPAERTRLNVRDSDGTLIIVPGTVPITDGTVLTIALTEKLKRSHWIIDLSKPVDDNSVLQWLQDSAIHVLNVAGPRESRAPGIYQKSYGWLLQFFSTLKTDRNE